MSAVESDSLLSAAQLEYDAISAHVYTYLTSVIAPPNDITREILETFATNRDGGGLLRSLRARVDDSLQSSQLSLKKNYQAIKAQHNDSIFRLNEMLTNATIDLYQIPSSTNPPLPHFSPLPQKPNLDIANVKKRVKRHPADFQMVSPTVKVA